MHQTKNTRPHGFTLIELMITVAIIAILAAVALPSYRIYIERSYRAEAKTALLQNAQFLERHYAKRSSYLDGASLPTLPITQVPASGGAYYSIGYDNARSGAQGFQLEAVPTGTMSGDACGTLTLNHVGQRRVGSDASRDAAACWGH
ncbi:MAG: prepilin-type N-terminal cleavage/methylation domain-containing protein [Marichromatium sp.]|nr:prepilin-type N-terminal cleavage/methylation domain-containing protein [Marichromatium sp.]